MKVNVENKYVVYDDYAEIHIVGGKHDGLVFKIDLEDVERCKEFKWYGLSSYNHTKNVMIYGTRVKPNHMLLHRFILDITGDEIVDHVNGDTLNCTKDNLRVATHSQNTINKSHKNENTKSGRRGVFWYKHTKTPKWVAHITLNGKKTYLGYFDKLEDAIKARMDAELEYFGEHLR